jgi:hypothetical protein
MTLITFNYPQIINAGLTVTNISLYIIIRVFMYMTKKKPNKKIKMWSDISTYSFCHVRYSTCNAEPSLKMKLSAIFDLLRLSEGRSPSSPSILGLEQRTELSLFLELSTGIGYCISLIQPGVPESPLSPLSPLEEKGPPLFRTFSQKLLNKCCKFHICRNNALFSGLK